MGTLRLCLASLSLVFLAGCEPNPTEVWDIQADPSVCDNGVDFQFCRHYTSSGDFGTLYQSIGGLDMQDGYSYRVEVEIIEVEDPGTDGSSVRYELVELLEQESHPGLEFDLRLPLGSIEVDEEGGAIATANDFTCTPEQCTELGMLIGEGSDLVGTFRFGPVDQLLPLELVSFAVAPE